MKLFEALLNPPAPLRFGTSGLRAPVVDMTDLECYINTSGFLKFLAESDNLLPGDQVYVAGDLRDSTPRILAVVATAIFDQGYRVVNCGNIPTPALAYYAALQHGPAIMVTGSHIPADRNGIKFYKRSSEVLKLDEEAIQNAIKQERQRVYELDTTATSIDASGVLRQPVDIGSVEPAARTCYVERFTGVFAADSLAGLKLVFYEQSATGRDIIIEVLKQLGATVVPAGRSDTFIPIDTENITQEETQRFKAMLDQVPGADALISTDGDSDRPIVVDEKGEFHSGDMLGCLVAQLIGAHFAAVPITCNDGIDVFCQNHAISLVKTKVGSPYVISAMASAAASLQPAVGWEGNGGFMTHNDVQLSDKVLKALPTRDSVLPIVAALLLAHQQKLPLSELFSTLPQRFTSAGLVDNMSEEAMRRFRIAISDNSVALGLAQQVFRASEMGSPQNIDLTDGLRMKFASGDVIHLRPSSNAPQFRVYANAASEQAADQLVAQTIAPDGYIAQFLTVLNRDGATATQR